MTAISAVRLLLRPILFLVAIAAAVIAFALIDSHTAFACEAIRRPVAHHAPIQHRSQFVAVAKKAETSAAPAERHARSFQPASALSARIPARSAPVARVVRIQYRPVAAKRLLPARPVAFVARTPQSAPAQQPAPSVPPADGATTPQQPPALVTLPAVPAAPSNAGTSPAAPSHPTASREQPSRLPILSDANLAGRLESALSLAAVASLFPLLAIVVLLQIRLLRMLRWRQPVAPTSQPITRHYSLTQEQARELAPDLLIALAHHRFCESDRHHGRQKRATWLELEETDSEPTRMWGTCETCHHQRMAELSGHGRLAAQ